MYDLTFAFLLLAARKRATRVRATRLISELLSIQVLLYIILNFRTTLRIFIGRNGLVHCQEGQDNLGEGGWGFILQMVRSTFELN